MQNNLVLRGVTASTRRSVIWRKGAYKMSFVEVAKVEEIPVGTMKGFTVAGKEILVVNYQGKLYAIGKICTHAGGDLSKGKLEGNIVTCPRHGSKFDVTTGKNVAGPKIGFIRGKTGNESAYEVKLEGNSIQVNV
jgi:3-phenylpropionate/trans-cinnamate dioxygenase ferredoxin subunit